MYADCRSNVLVHGETGVGKERVARLLRPRGWADGPFVAVNCGAIPEGLFEAHFSATPGAFTGAVGAHKGYFEQASGGTLFLDEIGDLPLYQQVKLLRVLEQSTVTRLGSANEVPVDFRLVAATNKDLRVLVAQDEFRADLYYRLAVIELRIPSLEQRGAAEKVALFRSLLERMGAGDEPPDWLLERVGATRYEAMCASCPTWPSAWPSSGASSSPGTGRASSASSTSWPSRCAARRDGRGRRAVRAAGVHRCRTGRARPHPGRAGRQRLAPAGHRQYPGHQPQGAVGKDAQTASGRRAG